MPWVTDAVFGSKLANGVGDLRNPNFPLDVSATQSWMGTIDAVNTGIETHTFRIRINDVAGDSFDLGPGTSHTHSESGIGPSDFWIYLDRWVDVEEGWVDWIKRHKLVLGIASVCGVGMVTVAVAWSR